MFLKSLSADQVSIPGMQCIPGQGLTLKLPAASPAPRLNFVSVTRTQGRELAGERTRRERTIRISDRAHKSRLLMAFSFPRANRKLQPS